MVDDSGVPERGHRRYVRRERKWRELRVLQGLEAGEIGGKYSIMLIISLN